MDALGILGAAGIRRVELAIGVPAVTSQAAILSRLKAQGWEFRVHHNFAMEGFGKPIDLCFGLDERQMTDLLDLCCRTGSPVYSIHPGLYRDAVDRIHAQARFTENLRRLRALAEARGILLAVETMYPTPRHTPRYLADDDSGLQWLMSLAETEDVGLVVDAAHLNIGLTQGRVTMETALRLFSHRRTAEVHVSDNDGVHDIHTPMRPESWFWSAVHELPSTVPVVIESRVQTVEDVVSQTLLFSSRVA